MRLLLIILALLAVQPSEMLHAAEQTKNDGEEKMPEQQYVDSVVAGRKLIYAEGLQLLSTELSAQLEAAREFKPFNDAQIRALERPIEYLVAAPISHAVLRIPRQRDELAFGVLGDCHVVQVVSPDEMHVVRGDERIIIREYPTKDFVKNRSLKPGGVFAFVGTETYTTVNGFENSAPIVKPLPPESVRDALVAADRFGAWRSEYRSLRAKHNQALEDLLWRDWKSSDGKYSLRAKFVLFENGVVTLEREDGSTIEVELKKLSSEDGRYLRAKRKYEFLNKRSLDDHAEMDKQQTEWTAFLNRNSKATPFEVAIGQLEHRAKSQANRHSLLNKYASTLSTLRQCSSLLSPTSVRLTDMVAG